MAVTIQADQRRAEIASRAAMLFDERGYHQTSMEEIAEAVGLRKPTLYHYCKSKEQILYWIHDEFIDLLISRQRARQATRLEASQQLLEVMADILELMHTHRGHVRVFFEHHRELSDEYGAEIKEKRDWYYQSVVELIERGQREGVLSTTDASLATLGIFGVCNWAYQWYDPDGPLRAREIAYFLWDLVVHGLGSTEAQPPATRGKGHP